MAKSSMPPATFGHRHLAFWFVPLLTVDDSGSTFKGRKFSWADVRSVDEIDLSTINAGTARYRARIVLTDGTPIHLNGRALEKDGIKPRIGFFTTRSDAFDELLGMFQRRAI